MGQGITVVDAFTETPFAAGSAVGARGEARHGSVVVMALLPLALTAADYWEARMTFSLSSSAFAEGASIPVNHTCDGQDVSPPLGWSDAPQGTASFALIMDDPDAPAGTWVHWVLFNLAATVSSLPGNLPKTETLRDLGGALQGRNDFRRIGYGGPCPPPGRAHRYFFKLYALDAALQLGAGATKRDVEQAMRGHVRATAQLVGTYARRRR